jgi:hypothetical protein
MKHPGSPCRPSTQCLLGHAVIHRSYAGLVERWARWYGAPVSPQPSARRCSGSRPRSAFSELTLFRQSPFWPAGAANASTDPSRTPAGPIGIPTCKGNVKHLHITPALGVAIAALVLAASGVSYAAATRSPGTISGCVHHKGGGLYVARKCARHDRRLTWSVRGLSGSRGTTGASGTPGAAGTPGTPGTPGQPGTPGASATRLFAQVESDDTINASSGGGITAAKEGTGVYLVNLEQDITHCAAIAQQGALPAFTSPGGSSGGSMSGAALVQISSAGGPAIQPGVPNADTVVVQTFAGASPSNQPFYLAVVC